MNPRGTMYQRVSSPPPWAGLSYLGVIDLSAYIGIIDHSHLNSDREIIMFLLNEAKP